MKTENHEKRVEDGQHPIEEPSEPNAPPQKMGFSEKAESHRAQVGDRLELEVREDLVHHLLGQVEQVDGCLGEVGRGLMMGMRGGRVRVVGGGGGGGRRLRGLARHALQPGEHHVVSARPARLRPQTRVDAPAESARQHGTLCHRARSAIAFQFCLLASIFFYV